MNRQEHLLTIAAEECMEVAQRMQKALRFGLDEVQPGQSLTNAERIIEEYNDLRAVMSMLTLEGYFKSEVVRDDLVMKKINKVESFLNYSKDCGTLTV